MTEMSQKTEEEGAPYQLKYIKFAAALTPKHLSILLKFELLCMNRYGNVAVGKKIIKKKKKNEERRSPDV